ncbi:HEPN domain-containing protein [Desulforamulus aeronauticus]|uniref:Uncharacterized protein, contains HEPN domain, UPF0332 family n=1 Tax=Desulforamulus aeronauticus DSM 10349 TaxID=1121421 RepID=A0A1M6ST02_9FIRM|nr:HEPN domain-containing protein [Desulforamulus aeronauticus]SHK47708.1 Uncharacterized protein, contains HEPN domain, UPF0332 family [Desulforamulus aeronauticus DSM 10349]
MIKDLVLWRIEKAERTFQDADLLLERDSFASAINRYYYAAFYAIRALLATKELDSPKHSGVISLFNREFVKTNLFSKKASKTITKVFDLRSTADYEDYILFEKQEVLAVRQNVRDLLDEIAAYISKEWFK